VPLHLLQIGHPVVFRVVYSRNSRMQSKQAHQADGIDAERAKRLT